MLKKKKKKCKGVFLNPLTPPSPSCLRPWYQSTGEQSRMIWGPADPPRHDIIQYEPVHFFSSNLNFLFYFSFLVELSRLYICVTLPMFLWKTRRRPILGGKYILFSKLFLISNTRELFRSVSVRLHKNHLNVLYLHNMLHV